MSALHRLRTIPPLPLVASVALFSLLAVWSFLTPQLGGPDEANHVDLVFHLAAGNPYPEFDERELGSETLKLDWTQRMLLANEISQGHRTVESAAPVDFGRVYDAEADVDARWIGNQMPQHPPFYYLLASWLTGALRLLPGDLSFTTEVQLLRIFNAALMAPLPLLVWGSARRLDMDERISGVAAMVPLAVPQLAHLGGTVNNDNLLTPLMALAVFFSVPALRGSARARDGMLIGAASGLAALTKGFALVLPVWFTCCYVVGALRLGRSHLRVQTLRSWVAACTTFVLVSGWFWVANLVEHGKISPSIHSSFPERPDRHIDALWFVGEFCRLMVIRFWGEFGYHELPIAIGVIWGAMALAILSALLAFTPSRRVEVNRPSRRSLAALLVLPTFLFTFTIIRSWFLYIDEGIIRFAQGRYLFGGLVPLAIVGAVGWKRIWRQRAPVVIAAVAVLVQGHAAHRALERWWGLPNDSVRDSIRSLLAWHPTTEPLLWSAAATLTVCTILLVLTALRLDGGPTFDPAASPAPPNQATR